MFWSEGTAFSAVESVPTRNYFPRWRQILQNCATIFRQSAKFFYVHSLAVLHVAEGLPLDTDVLELGLVAAGLEIGGTGLDICGAYKEDDSSESENETKTEVVKKKVYRRTICN